MGSNPVGVTNPARQCETGGLFYLPAGQMSEGQRSLAGVAGGRQAASGSVRRPPMRFVILLCAAAAVACVGSGSAGPGIPADANTADAQAVAAAESAGGRCEPSPSNAALAACASAKAGDSCTVTRGDGDDDDTFHGTCVATPAGLACARAPHDGPPPAAVTAC